MAGGLNRFRQKDVTRALRAAAAAGIKVARFKIDVDGSLIFIAACDADPVVLDHTTDMNRFRLVITDYKASPGYRGLAYSTQVHWSKWLDRIADHFGELQICDFNKTEQIRPLIRRWRYQWVATPRTADYAMQVLSRVVTHAVETGQIAGNPCEGIKHLYSGDRSEIIWTESDIRQLKNVCSAEISSAVDLAVHTGLRLGDLLRLSWSHVGDDAIVLTTNKSRHRREAIIPLYDALRKVLALIPNRASTILTSSKKRPWTPAGFGSSFHIAKSDAGIAGRDLHFNDLRGTAATKFYIAGFNMREIAETFAWEEETVERIIRRYVGRSAAIKARIGKLEAFRI
jgi:integrase